MVEISCVYATARDDYPMIGRPHDHQFDVFLRSMEQQTFRDFEVIIVDVLHDRRDYDFGKYSFPIKHISPFPNLWLERNMWAFGACFNRGIERADGRLVGIFGDCSEYPPGYLSKALKWSNRGYIPSSVFRYKCCNVLKAIDHDDIHHPGTPHGAKGTRISKAQGYEYLVDSRSPSVDQAPDGIYYHTGQQWYGFSLVPLGTLFMVNGFDENFDGCKSLTDCDLGMRMEKHTGSRFVMDKRFFHFENLHARTILVDTIVHIDAPKWKCQLSILTRNMNMERYVANTRELSDEDIEFIIEHGKHQGILEPDMDLIKLWQDNPHIFNLREEWRSHHADTG